MAIKKAMKGTKLANRGFDMPGASQRMPHFYLRYAGAWLLLLLGASSCSSISIKPLGPVPWEGKFVGTDHRYYLYLEAPEPEEPDLIDVYTTPSGRSKDDSDAVFSLFRIRGERAFSTHVRRALENSCPQEMRRGSDGIQLIDRCGGAIDYSGFYRRESNEGGGR